MSVSVAQPGANPAAAKGESTLDLLIVIVNFRTPDLTIQCLESLRGDAESMPGLFVVVADNCSGDESVARIGEAIERGGWSRWCKLVALPRIEQAAGLEIPVGKQRAPRHLAPDVRAIVVDDIDQFFRR